MDPSLNSLPELLAQRVSDHAEKPFLFSESDGGRFTYAEFSAAVKRAARMLAAAGVGKGDAVSLLMPNSVEYIIAYFACWELGALAGPINSLLKAEETEYVISNSEAKALLVHSEFTLMIDTIKPNRPELKSIIEFDDGAKATGAFAEEM